MIPHPKGTIRGRNTMRRSGIMMMAALVGAALVALVVPIQSVSGEWRPGHFDQESDRLLVFCRYSRGPVLERYVEGIEKSVRPTETQRLKLVDLKTALEQARSSMRPACVEQSAAATPLERLAFAEKALETMQYAVRTVRPAMEVFYASLDDDQKTRMNKLQPGAAEWRWLSNN